MAPQRSCAWRVVLSVSVWLSPIAAAKAEPPSAAAALTPRSVAAVTVRLADALRTEVAEPWPIEVAAAASEEFLGVGVESIERVTVIAEPPAGPLPLWAMVVHTSAQVSLDQLDPRLTAHTTPSELEGRPFLESQQAFLPSFCTLDEGTLAVGAKAVLRRLLKPRADAGAPDTGEPEAGEPPLASAMRTLGGDQNHLHGAVILEPLRPLIQLGLNQARGDIPPEGQKYLGAVDLVSGAVVAVDLAGERESSLTVYANDARDGDRLEGLILAAIDKLRANMFGSEEFQELAGSDDPIQRAMAEYSIRSFERQVARFTPRRDDDRVFLIGEMNVAEPDAAVYAASLGLLVALLLPAVQAAREAARRNVSMSNMKQILLALHNHHDTDGAFPPQAIRGADRAPLLSWRVAILPYIEEQALYDRFHLDEPWDSPHNLALLSQMPETLIDPSSGLDITEGKTHYLAVAGSDTLFPPGENGLQFRSMTDGTAKTLAVVQVDDEHAVEWTKPADYDVAAHAADPVAGIGSLHPGVFLGGYADGHVSAIPLDIDPATLKALFTRNGGEQVEAP
ncbi:DUF1559 domain-containing protein [Botrimarina sp.]|uniref:DUF1559 family PulG-like putative transporter n=1 Tax=Botrimarina sp. TaxID=2795802 RepID=UPI0032EFC9B5